MYSEELFTKYADWKILKYFLDHPDEEIHVKELSRRLEISSGTASNALTRAAKDDLLKKKVIGNVHLYTLNQKNGLVTRLQSVVRRL